MTRAVLALVMGGMTAVGGCGPTADESENNRGMSTGSTSTAQGGESGSLPGSEPGTGAPGGSQCETGGDWAAGDGGGDQDGGEDTGFGMGDDMPLSVFQIQQGAASAGSRVRLSNVLVTSPIAAGEAIGGVEFFVQELEGGPYSGLRIQTFASQIEQRVTVGETIDISGQVAQKGGYYMLLLDSGADVTPTGTAEPPGPPVLAASELSMQRRSARTFEGVVVRVEQATVTDAAPCRGEFTLEDAVRVDDRFVPNALQLPEIGQVIAQLQGVLVFADDAYELAPITPMQ